MLGSIVEPIFIKEFLPQSVLSVAYQYTIVKYSNHDFNNFDTQANSMIAEYGDYLMETILDISTSVVEKNVGKTLWPTYSYLRIYDKGSDLPIHKDRGSCEYTVAVCLGAQPNNEPYEIFIGEENNKSDYKYFDDSGNFNRYEIKHKFPMIPNNALLFQGMDKIHWREKCKHDHFVTLFLHYVDQEGNYKEWKFDKRKQIGSPK